MAAIPLDDLALVEGAIQRDPNLADLAYSWQLGPDGFDAKPIGPELLARFLIARTVETGDPEAAVASLLDLAAADASHYRLIALLRGIEVAEGFEIAPGLQLLPANEVELGPNPGLTSAGWAGAALVERIPYSPVFRRRSKLPDQRSPAWRADRARRIASLVALASHCAVAVTCVCLEGDDPRLPAGPGSTVMSSPIWTSNPNPLGTNIADPDQVRSVIREYLSFAGEFGALDIAIDRLNRARGNAALADRAIDLGIATEVVLRHESGKPNEPQWAIKA